MNPILEIRACFDTVSGAMSYKYFFNGEEQTEEEAHKIFGHNISAKHLKEFVLLPSKSLTALYRPIIPSCIISSLSAPTKK